MDMEATRLVFVMLKGAKPMRKVAIPITDTMSWHAFENQVKTTLSHGMALYRLCLDVLNLISFQVKSKLRIRGIQAMTMAAVSSLHPEACLSLHTAR